MKRFLIIETCNYGKDYPDEKFVTNLPLLRTKEEAESVADVLNKIAGENSDRFWQAVVDGYSLSPGFEP